MPMYHDMEKCRGSRFTHYIRHVAPNTKPYLRRTGKLYTSIHIRAHPVTIASMRLRSHALRCETGCWGTSDECGRLCTLCPKQVRESEYHNLIQCSAFDHIQPCFRRIFDQAQSMHEFLSQPQCALSIATFICKVLKHRDLLLTFTCIT